VIEIRRASIRKVPSRKILEKHLSSGDFSVFKWNEHADHCFLNQEGDRMAIHTMKDSYYIEKSPRIPEGLVLEGFVRGLLNRDLNNPE